MKHLTTPHFVAAALVVASLLCGTIKAQEEEEPPPTPETVEQKTGAQSVPKVEIGELYSQLSFFGYSNPFLGYSERKHTIGWRVTYNLTPHLAVETEANFFPTRYLGDDGYVSGGRPFQTQFGGKAGKRFRRFSLFAKARPGFVTFSETFTPKLGERVVGFGGQEYFFVDSVPERKTHFSLDVGVVTEVYASPRVFARFDAGNTMIRYGRHREVNYLEFGSRNAIFQAPTRTEHNLQFSMGVGVRVGALSQDDADRAAATGTRARPLSVATRFEAGAHFTGLSFSPIRQLAPFLFSGSGPGITALGFGGRFTYNLTGHLAVEAETNLLPQKINLAVGASGRVTQGQSGIKAGHRFRSFGLFAKARPGFVSFGSSLKQIGITPFDFGDIHSFRGVFEIGRRTFFSADVGGVLELYPSRRWLVRLDGGDTIIRYGERSINNFISIRRAISVAPPETRHNFQFSTGVGFRF